MEQIPVCTHYRVNGVDITEFPFPDELENAEPVIRYLKGWKCDITQVRKWEDLPEEARDYVLFIEKAIQCPITYISVGPERDSLIRR